MEDIFPEEQQPVYGARDDDLPPPAYTPQAPEPRVEDNLDSDPEEFVAPRAAPAGTPSPEAMARLRSAVDNAPGARQQQQARAPREEPRGESSERSRFGINSLINRMTGHGNDGGGSGAARGAQASRQQPPVQGQRAQAQSHYEDEADPDQERIEIPAFLRRQAN